MKQIEVISKATDYIELSQEGSAIELLKDFIKTNHSENDHLINQITLFAARHSAYKMKERSGLLSHSEANIELNQIRYALLDFITFLGKQSQQILDKEREILESGIQKFHEEDYVYAIMDFEESSKKNQKNAVHYFFAGSSFMNLEQYDKAIENFKNAIKLEPEVFVFHVQIAACYLFKEDYKNALKFLNSAENLFPDEVRVNILKSIVYLLQKDFDNLLEMTDKIRAVTDEEEDYVIANGMKHFFKGICYVAKGNKGEDKEFAIDNLKKSHDLLKSDNDFDLIGSLIIFSIELLEKQIVPDWVPWRTHIEASIKEELMPFVIKELTSSGTTIILKLAEKFAKRQGRWFVEEKDALLLGEKFNINLLPSGKNHIKGDE